MSPKDDFIHVNQKTPPFSGYKTEKKSPFFWIILATVGAVTIAVLFLIVRTGSQSSAPVEKKDETPPPVEEKKPPPPADSKAKPPGQEEGRTVDRKLSETQIPGDLASRIQAAENMISSGNLVEARKMLYEMHSAATAHSPALAKIEEMLGKVNVEIFKSDIPCPEKKLYTIEKGDALVKIADRFKTTVEAVQTANRMDPGSHTIFPGKTLCIYQGEWSIKVSKSRMELRLFDGDKLFKVYKVGIGRQGRTPSGEFEISMKQKDPVWYTDGKAIPFGDKQNILGTRWLALAPVGSTDKSLKGYGIHGTWEADSIGQATSNGCVRMRNEEVEELFSMAPQKTTVIIED